MYTKESVGFNFNKTALLLNSGADGVFNAAISQYKAMTSYLKWEDLGIITIPGMIAKGSIKSSPKLNDVYELGKSI